MLSNKNVLKSKRLTNWLNTKLCRVYIPNLCGVSGDKNGSLSDCGG